MNAVLIFFLIVVNTLKQLPAEEITEEYIQEVAKGIEDFRKTSQENIFKDRTFDPLKYDERAAFQNAVEYDFIIVGSGASGAVIANRLSEIPEWKVLLLEAGEIASPYTDIPIHSGILQGSKYNWGYLTEPQTTCCLGMIDQKCTAPTGKGLGGATVINGMIYTRGNARDYDLWAGQGNDGWSFKEVLPYFKKAEDCSLNDFDPKYHRQGGPLYVEEAPYVLPLQQLFFSAGKEIGHKILDYNGRHQIGFGKIQATTKGGKRNSASTSYLLPTQNRKNIHIQPLSHVIQILINPHTKEAFGVKYLYEDYMYVAKARNEVIVAAGPFNSPQLLMLSGIGPREDLEKLGIPVVKDLQVGRQLRDHAGFQGATFLLNITKFNEPNTHDQIEAWLKHGKGPLSTSGMHGLAFLKTSASKEPGDYPDVELIISKSGFAPNLRMREEYRPLLEPGGDYASFRISVMPTHPKSLGSVRLKSKDPLNGPLINSSFFSDPEGRDLKTMVAGIKEVLGLVQTEQFKKVGARLVEEPVKQCKHLGFGSDEYWKCAARYLSISLRHQIGTCRMGPRSDKNAVVDNKLRVYGVQKLRVADSSVIPVPITGHTHAAANMVGEKASHIIKEHWQVINSK